MTTLYSALLYVISLFIFLSSNSIITIWLSMEVNLITFLGLCWSTSNDKYASMMIYFLCQSGGSMLFLISIISSQPWASYALCVALCAKAGFFPFFQWVFSLGSSLGLIPFLTLITIQKLPVLYLIFLLSFSYNLILISSLVGCFFLVQNPSFPSLLISSSLSSSLWMMFLFNSSFLLFFFYYMIYSSSIIAFSLTSYGVKKNISMASLCGFLCGLPPFSLFIFKFSFINLIFLAVPSVDLFFLTFLTFASLFGYVKFFWPTFKTHKILKGKTFLATFMLMLMSFAICVF